jgi:ABC-type branched-subunit amino acid transport system substrate-binding protein
VDKIKSIIIYLVARENELARQIVKQAVANDPNAVITNAAHDEILKTLKLFHEQLTDEIMTKKEERPRLRLVAS